MKLRGLYAIVDTVTLARVGLEPVTFALEVLAARPAALQLRAKDLTPAAMTPLARTLLAMCADAGVPFVVNDHPVVAKEIGAKIVHLGQDDGASPDAIEVGRSTHSTAQLASALESKLAYVAFGPVFSTASKDRPDPVVGIDGLRAARAVVAARGAEIPLVAIGGISLENAAKIGEFADAGAVIGALVAPNVTARARELHLLLGGAP